MTNIPRPLPSFLDTSDKLHIQGGKQAWASKDRRRYYAWDAQHREIEGFDSRGSHLGALNSISVRQTKEAAKGGISMSEALTFIDHCLRGSATPDQIDDHVAQWHDGVISHGLELRELLGMSRQEYAMWLQDAHAIHKIIAARQEQFSKATDVKRP